jgi:hypothetical protein
MSGFIGRGLAGLIDAKQVMASVDRLIHALPKKPVKGKVESGVKHTVSRTRELFDAIEALTGKEVLVGIPKDKADREDENGEPITNASLAYIHEYGSAKRNIPARPFLHPGIRKAKERIISIMRRGAMEALVNHDKAAGEKILEQVGMVARNSIIREIRDPTPPYAPLQPATIRARLRRTAAGRRKLREIKAGGKHLGMAMPQILTTYAQASWGSGPNMRPLIDTGQLRAAISYVVRDVE